MLLIILEVLINGTESGNLEGAFDRRFIQEKNSWKGCTTLYEISKVI